MNYQILMVSHQPRFSLTAQYSLEELFAPDLRSVMVSKLFRLSQYIKHIKSKEAPFQNVLVFHKIIFESDMLDKQLEFWLWQNLALAGHPVPIGAQEMKNRSF